MIGKVSRSATLRAAEGLPGTVAFQKTDVRDAVEVDALVDAAVEKHGRIDGLVCNDALILPHPRAHNRGFVLLPLAEVAPEWRHPVNGKTVRELLAALPQEDVRLI